VLRQASAGALTFQNVTVTGGTAPAGNGGAISAPSSAVTVTNSTFTNNTAPGGHSNGGAIDGGGVMTVTNSTFTNNSVGDLGGGGAIYDAGAVTVTNSTFTNNTAGEFAGGGAIYDGAVGDGGVTVTNSTFTNNSAGADSIGGGAIFADGAVTVAYGTLTGNAASRGSAAVSNTSIKSFGSVFVKPAGTGNLCNTGTSLGYNFANETAPGSCNLNATGDNASSTNDPLLGPLANNGGPTQTQLPQDGPSPLIDAIPNAACQTAPLATGITTDQRGLPRPDSASPNCDIGAVEVQSPAATTLVVTAAFTG